MARDYKNARKPAGGGRGGGGLSGKAGLALGLALGLGVALAVHLHDRRPAAGEQKPVADKQATPRSTGENGEDTADKKYDFYDMLPKFEVVVPEREKAEPAGAAPAAIDRPGSYILQAGSYKNFAEADRARAQLALQGIESKIQRVTVDNDTWHRIRIGPIGDLGELNRTRERLRAANIKALLIRVGD